MVTPGGGGEGASTSGIGLIESSVMGLIDGAGAYLTGRISAGDDKS